MKEYFLTALLFGLVLASAAVVMRSGNEEQKAPVPTKWETSFSLASMGHIPISLTAHGIGKDAFQRAESLVRAELDSLSRLISIYDPRSLISRINRGEDVGSLPVRIWAVLRSARVMSEITEGSFDITVGPLKDLWSKAEKEKRLPLPDERKRAFEKVGFRKFSLLDPGSPEGAGVKLLLHGAEIDLGGIAKGWFSEVALDILRAEGALRAVVAVGGDMSFWDADQEAEFLIGVKHPEKPDSLFAALRLKSGSISTSGGYYRFYDIDQKRYSHIFDPKTGEPKEGDVLSATVFAPTGIQADAFSTAVYVMGSDSGVEFIEKQRGVEVLVIRKGLAKEGYELFPSSGLSGRVVLEASQHSSSSEAAVGS